MTNDPSFQQPVNIGAHEQEMLKRQAETAPDEVVEANEPAKKPKGSKPRGK